MSGFVAHNSFRIELIRVLIVYMSFHNGLIRILVFHNSFRIDLTQKIVKISILLVLVISRDLFLNQ